MGTELVAGKGSTFNSVVASFTDTDPVPGSPSAYAAVIDWGDGSRTSVGTISAGSGRVFNITGTHSYTNEGRYQISVTVTDKDISHDDGGSSVRVASTATVVTGPSGTNFQTLVSAGAGLYALATGDAVYQYVNSDWTRISGSQASGIQTLVSTGAALYALALDDHAVYQYVNSGWARITDFIVLLLFQIPDGRLLAFTRYGEVLSISPT